MLTHTFSIMSYLTPVLEARFWSKVDKKGPQECWPWNGTRGKGERGQFWLSGRMSGAPRVSWVIEHREDIPPGYFACHSCDNAWCVNPAHLWLGDVTDNARDALSKGRYRVHARHPLAKLDIHKVRDARRRMADGETYIELAREYGVDSKTMWSVSKGLIWVEPEEEATP